MAFVLWLAAVVLVVYGLVRTVGGAVNGSGREAVIGVAFIILGFLVGPGGVSLFDL